MIEFPTEQYDKLLVMDTRVFSRYDKLSLDELYADLRADLCNTRRFCLSETISGKICFRLLAKGICELKFLIFSLLLEMYTYLDLHKNFYISYFI